MQCYLPSDKIVKNNCISKQMHEKNKETLRKINLTMMHFIFDMKSFLIQMAKNDQKTNDIKLH